MTGFEIIGWVFLAIVAFPLAVIASVLSFSLVMRIAIMVLAIPFNVYAACKNAIVRRRIDAALRREVGL